MVLSRPSLMSSISRRRSLRNGHAGNSSLRRRSPASSRNRKRKTPSPARCLPPFAAFIAALPEADRFKATMLLCCNLVFHRHHPFVRAFLAANGMSDEQADDIWRAGAVLG